MALRISLTTPFGVPATYWKISEIRYDYAEAVAYCTLVGYLDRATRMKGATEMDSRRFVFSGDQFPAEGTRKEMYTLMKSNPEFMSAADI